ncbi:MAG TPA: DUF3987 domain-containing protein [Candidatus Paceibacterota bacterium]
MYFWVGASTIAGVLRRRVWIDQAYFRWHPNMYVILVAPPGIVSKSTTAGIGMRLLRQVPGIRFGPDVVTWQALVGAFAEASEAFELNGEFHTMSPITIESSEFGNLLNPQDKDMVDLLVSLWDGKTGTFEKRTKMSGNDSVENPWINLIACTTPSWIAGNFPEYMIGGGFTSRCIFVYADRKERYVAYPGLVVPENLKETEQKLVQDLEHISLNLMGEYKLLDDAIQWGEAWYQRHYTQRPEGLDDDRFGGYIARKQTHIHKLAMILAAATHDSMVISAADLAAADEMVTDLEADMPMVFSKIGRTDESLQVDRFLSFVRKVGRIKAADAYRFIHSYFPQAKDYEEVLKGATRAGFIEMRNLGGELWIVSLDQRVMKSAGEFVQTPPGDLK